MNEQDGRFEVEDSRWNRLLLTGNPDHELPWNNEDVEKKYDSELEGVGTDLIIYDISDAGPRLFNYTVFFHNSDCALKFGEGALDHLDDVPDALENSGNVAEELGHSGPMRRLYDKIGSLEHSKNRYVEDLEYIAENFLD